MVDRALVGVHAPNKEYFNDNEYGAIEYMGLECLKMMGHTQIGVYSILLEQNPDMIFIVRLYDTQLQDKYFNQGRPPPVGEYVAVHTSILSTLLTVVPSKQLFVQIHNEPNHLHNYEGWGQETRFAHQFAQWYEPVLNGLRDNHPQLSYGFPPMAIPHNDHAWLLANVDNIKRSDWLGIHCYWQNPTEADHNELDSFWGCKWIDYGNLLANAGIPDIPMVGCEAGNSNHQNNLPTTPERVADELISWYAEGVQIEQVKSLSPFILGSSDPTWRNFVWVYDDGSYHPVVHKVRDFLLELKKAP